MSTALEHIKAAALGGTLAYEMARMEEERLSWRKAVLEADLIGRQARELAEGSAYAQVAKELEALRSPVGSVAQQYQEILGASSAVGSALTAWQESERIQREQMRKMFDPMVSIRESVLGNSAAQQLIKELREGSSVPDYVKGAALVPLGIGPMAQTLAQYAEDSRTLAKTLLEDVGVGSSIERYLKSFEDVNKHWKVPIEVLGIVGSFKELQEQLGNIALPTIDWGSAAALAKALGPEGIQEQLTLMGIEPDGSMREHAAKPERGILSRKQSDAVALVSLLLGLLFFVYQEISSQQDKAKTEAFQTQTTAILQAQTQQIQALTVLIGRALVQAAREPEECFVVRVRPATVRIKPEYGSTVEGKLMPNEVVRAIKKNGKWVEIEYYHWLHEEYRTGWVLKKYLERVPANHHRVRQQN